MGLSNTIELCDAVVKLLSPLVEVVIHDISENKIVYINGLLSRRKKGDESLLDSKNLNNLDKIVYPKINFDGKLVKSTSVLLGKQYLLCINCDVSIFSKMQDLSNTLLQMNPQPTPLFINDWQEKLHSSIHAYLQNHNLVLDNLNQCQKKALTKHLFDLGAFNQKNAADHISKSLKLGRATVFKYLKQWRNE